MVERSNGFYHSVEASEGGTGGSGADELLEGHDGGALHGAAEQHQPGCQVT